MKLARLRQMDVDELASRCRQQAVKWLERTCGSPRGGRIRDLDVAAVLRDGPQRFFAGATDPGTASAVRQRYPHLPAILTAEAESVLRGQFDLLSYRGLPFGHPIDWHLDPISGRQAPRLHWSRLDPLDFATVGDSKIVWELNRHQWMVRLGLAYRLTGDERYAEAVARRCLEWIDAN